MPDIASIVQIVLPTLAVAAPVVLLVGLLGGDAPGSATDLWSVPDFDAWPRGVQEEEPLRWGAPAATTAASA